MSSRMEEYAGSEGGRTAHVQTRAEARREKGGAERGDRRGRNLTGGLSPGS